MRNCKHCGVDLSTVTSEGLQCKSCRNYLARYGLNRLQVSQLHESQNGKCYICEKDVVLGKRRTSDSAYIDHCHKTGKVRKILCHPCNITVGMLENNEELLDKFISYIN